jgi:hypothetical protein
MAHGVILKHLEVDEITWGSFSKKKKRSFFFFLRGVPTAFSAGKRDGAPFF